MTARGRHFSFSSDTSNSSLTPSLRSDKSNSPLGSNNTVPTAQSEQQRPPSWGYVTADGRLEEETKVGRLDIGRATANSFSSYQSSVPSNVDVAEVTASHVIPADQSEVHETNVIPATPSDFAELFPSSRELLVAHDDATLDGNMNLRIDTSVVSSAGRKRKITLFHLRMYDLKSRHFSLRRYCRDSGREVCHSSRKLQKPSLEKRLTLQSSISSAFASLRSKPDVKSPNSLDPRRVDSGYDSMDEIDEPEQGLGSTGKSDSHAWPITETIKLTFSNYAQVHVKISGRARHKRYEFEYWGVKYAWRRILATLDRTVATSYELTLHNSKEVLACISPVPMSALEALEEAEAGGWIPPCSMSITDRKLIRAHDDMSDVVMATGLITLVDDSIRGRFHSETTRQLVIPVPLSSPLKLNLGKMDPKELVSRAFGKKPQLVQSHDDHD